MKNVSRLLPLLPGIALLTGCNQKVQKDNGQNSQKPNIIYIFADDLGIGDLSCYGATKVKYSPYRPPCRTGCTVHQRLCNFRHQYLFPLRTPDRYVPVATGRTQASPPETRN